MNFSDTFTFPGICFECESIFYGSHGCSPRPAETWSGSPEYFIALHRARLERLQRLIQRALDETDR